MAAPKTPFALSIFVAMLIVAGTGIGMLVSVGAGLCVRMFVWAAGL